MRNRPPYLSRLYSEASRFYGGVRSSLLSLCFPSTCGCCNILIRYPEVLCESCRKSLPWIRKPFCKLCGSPLQPHWRVKICPECKLRRPRLTRIRSLFLYESTIMQMIKQVKFSRRARPLLYFAEE